MLAVMWPQARLGGCALRPATNSSVHAPSTEGPILVARPRLPSAEAILPYLRQIDGARWYSNFGPLLTAFEARLAERFGPAATIVTAVNATQALTLTLKAMNLEPGGLCAAPAWTFVATAHAILEAGLTPWFVDVDHDSWMLEPDQMRAALTRAPGPVRAVIPVAAFGRSVDLEGWKAFRDETGVPVLVDAAAAFDSAHDAELPHVVSLHATKALGVGEGGFLATTDAALAQRVRQLTTYGFAGSRESHMPATNAKLSEYAAAVGLAALDGWPGDRLRFGLAAMNLRLAAGRLKDVTFQPGWGEAWVTSVCVVRTPDGTASAVEAALAKAGVDTRRWWGEGCHRSAAFAGLPHDDLGVTERLAGATIGLPFAVDQTPEEAAFIAEALDGALRQATA